MDDASQTSITFNFIPKRSPEKDEDQDIEEETYESDVNSSQQARLIASYLSVLAAPNINIKRLCAVPRS